MAMKQELADYIASRPPRPFWADLQISPANIGYKFVNNQLKTQFILHIFLYIYIQKHSHGV